MPKKKSTGAAKRAPNADASSAKSASRNTMSGPSNPAPPPADAAAQKAADTEALASAVVENPNKPGEIGRDNALHPPAGFSVEPPSPEVGASTLTERNASDKVGTGDAPAGVDPLTAPLDRVRVDNTGRVLTTNQGVAIADNQSSLKAGLRGPTLLEDFILREKITHFDHERIPERIVHARGSGAHGFFECTEPLTDVTRAAPFREAGKRTPVFVRFSTVAGERGSIDTARDVRGFAVKFYTDEGNWDLVGNNIPVFFIQDAMKFPDLVHAVKPEPHHGMPQASSAHDTFWDFISLMPESTHMMMWAMSDRAIPRSYRMMQGFGVHSYRFVNAAGASVFVKFHWSPVQGTHSLVWDEAVKIAGADADYHRRDLWEAIEAGEYPEWELGVQLFTEEQADAFTFDVLDATKIIPEELVPLRSVGRLVLNRNPDNFFAETEQVAFCTAHVVPGIDFSNDPLLAGRIHSYVDTQITRLGGPNFHEIPINSAVAPVHNNQRDGMHRQAIARGRVAYEPNSLAGGCPFQAGAEGFVSFPQRVDPEPDKLRGKPEKFADHYTQATLFYDSQTEWEKNHIVGAFRFELSRVTVPAIRRRMVATLRNVDEDLAARVADGLGLELPDPLPRLREAIEPEVAVSPALSLTARPGEAGVRTRRVAILVADGVEGASLEAIHTSLTNAGAIPRFVAPRLGTYATADGKTIEADASLENAPAVLFDGLVLPDGEAGVAALGADGHTMELIVNTYRHCKTMLVLGASIALLEHAGVAPQEGEADAGLIVVESARENAADSFMAALAKHRHPERETDPPRV
jgi:catalase